ncbi:hypothetical protein A1O1_08073 [Capronia coronata CBS 617.96]|uniref:Ig-like domain-containing protein n=1 Tax=Capronia coronata CBS 617.96 TaxID=1182541 RepID=W9XXB8_9EURO|nr:uncharacterized protein A1O1_08073 [Capronia coronata CBS 617.96]EXJ82005.1 hypothetical protein A1O1_08073 [Capronia coronata CBS 617.96]
MLSLLGRGDIRHNLLLVVCLATSYLAQDVSSQLVGCDVLGCQNGCHLGNVTTSFIGTTFFNTTVSPDAPLTWTVGASTQESSSNSTELEFVKNFYLGYPSSAKIASTSEIVGCALFFEGIAKSITLNGTLEYGPVTCGQTLGDDCVNDLVSQAQRQVKSLSDPSDSNTASVCFTLQARLEAQPPASCRSTATVTWGNVVAKEISGAGVRLDPIKQTSCHPSTGGSDYDIALVEVQTVTSEDVSSDNAPFAFSMTPVLTVFFNSSGANPGSSALPEAHLSCLKVVQDSSLTQSTTNTAASSVPRLPCLMAMSVLAMSAVAFV